ncbi:MULTISPECIES: hypothetical protein [Elizabethkingia]|uniref:Uncharacterized protein n=1 Tax=Elizabethkingia ursingii TaxID=1756150 RepID=A0AAJ3NED6_9FLAO|nr:MULTISPECIES: hypothetical protein [Elizabethkingia]AQW92913.1 hypothetical protein BBD30_01245 [Elizabethkingia anophelis]AQX09797.1 hypothetical protein BBD34_14625 [Elizabethkingia ursingii]OPB78667.1 hypothetical protein BAY32_00565 [Elizabethkingia ursingii]OPB92826.1 hypothetical protein BB021_00010 [Elizabethkingia ursingii]
MCEEEEKKKVYVSPQISVVEVELEQGIAAGSAQINPGTTGEDGIATDWDAGSGDQTEVVTWE